MRLPPTVVGLCLAIAASVGVVVAGCGDDTGSTGTAAGARAFSGTTSQNRPVEFTVADGEVRDFNGGVNIFCTGQGFQQLAAVPPVAMPLTDGRFDYQGLDVNQLNTIEIHGEIDGDGATGTVRMVASRFVGGMVSFCNGDGSFTAEAR